MTRRQIAFVALIVFVCSGLSAVVAYRRALRRFSFASAGSLGSSVGPCLDFHDAQAHIGETGCIAGRVGRVFTSRTGNTFLDFCADYRTCPFGTVIFSSDRSKFGNLETLGGRRVEIHGAITSYQGRAEIIIRDPHQVRVVP